MGNLHPSDIETKNHSVTSGDYILEISHREIQTKNHSSENVSPFCLVVTPYTYIPW